MDPVPGEDVRAGGSRGSCGTEEGGPCGAEGDPCGAENSCFLFK